ncbi:3-oxo-5-alpha-steroid 4-dehydrogenase 2 [Pteropus alecto]|uniref:3-oxo-5-alpha-steroid 4-dehydrogenase 2 n=1 Tax=Pteropus alecto TaxID=9402 RepID=L5KRM5_PTEAL|nr:3-oxo-5-alpha-steroid 4-dehydrogenase 2 [Pteropus alecto]
MGNGLLQGYYLAYCAEYPAEWYKDIRFSLGVFLFILGMGINIHSDYILRQLRKPGEITYKIPQVLLLLSSFCQLEIRDFELKIKKKNDLQSFSTSVQRPKEVQ